MRPIRRERKESMIAKDATLNIASLFKATRKFHKLHQTEFSAILGVTQGTISKIESALMSPELGLWFRFLKAFNIIDPYCFTYAGVEFNENAFKTLKTEGSVLAPKFDFKEGAYIFTVQKIRPLHDFMVKNHPKMLDAFLKENKISKEIFYILNHPLPCDFVDAFFGLLDELKINEKSMALLDLNFNSALGRHMDNLIQSGNNEEFFSIINSEKDNMFEYEIGRNKGEYIISLNKNSNVIPLHSMKKADVIMNYNMLYPFHVMKSTQNLKSSIPSISELRHNEQWQVQYAQ